MGSKKMSLTENPWLDQHGPWMEHDETRPFTVDIPPHGCEAWDAPAPLDFLWDPIQLVSASVTDAVVNRFMAGWRRRGRNSLVVILEIDHHHQSTSFQLSHHVSHHESCQKSQIIALLPIPSLIKVSLSMIDVPTFTIGEGCAQHEHMATKTRHSLLAL